MSIAQLCWLAGLFDGEGWFGTNYDRRRGKSYPAVVIGMTDPDVIERVRLLLPFGRVTIRPNKNRPWKPLYVWQASAQRHAASLMMTLYPLLGVRRQEQIRKALVVWRAQPQMMSGK